MIDREKIYQEFCRLVEDHAWDETPMEEWARAAAKAVPAHCRKECVRWLLAERYRRRPPHPPPPPPSREEVYRVKNAELKEQLQKEYDALMTWEHGSQQRTGVNDAWGNSDYSWEWNEAGKAKVKELTARIRAAHHALALEYKDVPAAAEYLEEEAREKAWRAEEAARIAAEQAPLRARAKELGWDGEIKLEHRTGGLWYAKIRCKVANCTITFSTEGIDGKWDFAWERVQPFPDEEIRQILAKERDNERI